jgi:hypothetical protein
MLNVITLSVSNNPIMLSVTNNPIILCHGTLVATITCWAV